ncbi:MAG: hypothetical protein ACLFR7_11975 [Opitutales bacterium]
MNRLRRRLWLLFGAGLAVCLLGASSMADWRTSRAFFSPEQEVSPLIQIRGTRITIQHRVQGSGEIRGTALRGERTYQFPEEGTYEVEPGRYQHLVYGSVPSGGSIESRLRYQ